MADAEGGAVEWQVDNALVLVGGILLLLGLRRRPTPADQPAPVVASAQRA